MLRKFSVFLWLMGVGVLEASPGLMQLRDAILETYGVSSENTDLVQAISDIHNANPKQGSNFIERILADKEDFMNSIELWKDQFYICAGQEAHFEEVKAILQTVFQDFLAHPKRNMRCYLGIESQWDFDQYEGHCSGISLLRTLTYGRQSRLPLTPSTISFKEIWDILPCLSQEWFSKTYYQITSGERIESREGRRDAEIFRKACAALQNHFQDEQDQKILAEHYGIFRNIYNQCIVSFEKSNNILRDFFDHLLRLDHCFVITLIGKTNLYGHAVFVSRDEEGITFCDPDGRSFKSYSVQNFTSSFTRYLEKYTSEYLKREDICLMLSGYSRIKRELVLPNFLQFVPNETQSFYHVSTRADESGHLVAVLASYDNDYDYYLRDLINSVSFKNLSPEHKNVALVIACIKDAYSDVSKKERLYLKNVFPGVQAQDEMEMCKTIRDVFHALRKFSMDGAFSRHTLAQKQARSECLNLVEDLYLKIIRKMLQGVYPETAPMQALARKFDRSSIKTKRMLVQVCLDE